MKFKPESARVGWARPTFNRIPSNSVLLESAGQIFETGIYAHAPARHEYRTGGQWLSLTGHVGLAAGHAGSVQFEIRGDGQSLWKSRTIEEDDLVEFEVQLNGINQVELLTHPTDDGTNLDWGLWLNPMLNRK